MSDNHIIKKAQDVFCGSKDLIGYLWGCLSKTCMISKVKPNPTNDKKGEMRPIPQVMSRSPNNRLTASASANLPKVELVLRCAIDHRNKDGLARSESTGIQAYNKFLFEETFQCTARQYLDQYGHKGVQKRRVGKNVTVHIIQWGYETTKLIIRLYDVEKPTREDLRTQIRRRCVDYDFTHDQTGFIYRVYEPQPQLMRTLDAYAKTYGEQLCDEHVNLVKGNDDTWDELIMFMQKAKNAKKVLAILDSGATRHVWKYAHDFSDINHQDTRRLSGISGKPMMSTGLGDLKNGLKGAMLVPNAPCNVVSLSQLLNENDCYGEFNRKTAYVRDAAGKMRIKAFYRRGLWWTFWDPAKHSFEEERCNIATNEEWAFHSSGYQSSMLSNRVDMLHKSFGHISHKGIRKMQKKGLIRTDYEIRDKDWRQCERFCDQCAQAKMKSRSAPKTSTVRATKFLQHVSVDIAEFEKSIDNFERALIIIDHFTGYKWCIPIKRGRGRSAHGFARKALFKFLFDIAAQHDGDLKFMLKQLYLPATTKVDEKRKIAKMRTDGGQEFNSKACSGLLRSWGVRHECTVPYKSHQNGKAEKAIQDIRRVATAYLSESKLNESYWSYAWKAATHAINRWPRRGNPESRSPVHAITGKAPDVSYMRPFGCPCWVLIPEALRKRRKKVAPISRSAIMLGYPSGVKGWTIKYTDTKRVVTTNTKDVIFDMRMFGECELSGSHKVPPRTKFEKTKGIESHRVQPQVKGPKSSKSKPAPQPTRAFTRGLNKSKPTPLENDNEETRELISDSDGYTSDESTIQKIANNKKTSKGPDNDIDARGDSDSIFNSEDSAEESVVGPPEGKEPEQEKELPDPPMEEVQGGHDDADEPDAVSGKRYNMRQRKPVDYATYTTDDLKQYSFYSINGPPPTDTIMSYDDENDLSVYGREIMNEAIFATLHDDTPESFEDAMKKPEWHASIKSELMNLLKNDTYEVIHKRQKPDNARLIDYKYVFKTKLKGDNTVDKYKTRLVGRGFSQAKYFDYDPDLTYAPVATFDAIRTTLAIAAAQKMHIHHLDVTGAFLIPKLEQSIFMTLPKGFYELMKNELHLPKDFDTEKHYLKLKKGLYGLKQSARLWYNDLSKTLKSLGFERSTRDTCVFTRREVLKQGEIARPGRVYDGSTSVIAAYVDDLTCCIKNYENMKIVKRRLMQRYAMTDSGEIKYLLGVNIDYDRVSGIIKFNQKNYIERIAQRFNIAMEGRKVFTPMTEADAKYFTNLDLLLGEKNSPHKCNATKFRGKIGALLFLARSTRPDIAVATHMSACASQWPTMKHMAILDRIFKYLITTRHLSLKYCGDEMSLQISTYTDSDWANRQQDGRSRTGYYCKLGPKGTLNFPNTAACVWKTTLQRTVAGSTPAAEYMAMSEAGHETFDLRGRLANCGYSQKHYSNIYCDNKAARDWAIQPCIHHKTKAIHTRYHIVRNYAQPGQNKIFNINWIGTSMNPSDLFTKILGRTKFELFRNAIMNCSDEIPQQKNRN